MQKQEILDISQTNLANFGTELEYKIKQAAAEGEPAFQRWVVTDSAEGTVSAGKYLWRVKNFRLEEVSLEHTPDFFRGDCYLALSIIGFNRQFKCNIYYWIGDSCSIDEAGTAAYKAFELDSLLTARNAPATQYREVCGAESNNFLSLFHGMRIVIGGYDSGFHHVDVPEHKNHLLRVYRDITPEVPLQWDSLRTNGVFILDAGTKIYQWSGSKVPMVLRAPAMAAVRALDDVRGINSQVIVLNEGETGEDAEEFARELGVTAGATVPEEVAGARGFTPTGLQDPITGRRVGSAPLPTQYVSWNGDSFQTVDSKPTDGICIEDYPDYCIVHTHGRALATLPALCAMAYFTWAKKSPVNCQFVYY